MKCLRSLLYCYCILNPYTVYYVILILSISKAINLLCGSFPSCFEKVPISLKRVLDRQLGTIIHRMEFVYGHSFRPYNV